MASEPEEEIVDPGTGDDHAGESFAERVTREMVSLGMLKADDANEGEGSDDAEPASEPEAEEAKAQAKPEADDAYSDFGRRVAEGMERDPVGTLRRLRELALQQDPGLSEKLDAKADDPAADDDPLNGEEPLTEFERTLWPHARELSETPARVAAVVDQMGRMADHMDATSVAVRAAWDIVSALAGDARLPALDTDTIMAAVRGGQDFDQVYAQVFRDPMLAALKAHRQAGRVRPDQPSGRSGSRASDAQTFAEMYSDDTTENQMARVRAGGGLMRPIGRVRPRR